MNKLLLLSVCSASLMWTACSKPRPMGGAMDTPETHYLQGKSYMLSQQWDKACEEFALAKSLNKKFGPALGGLGLCEAQKGNFDEAEDLIDDAIDYVDDRNGEGYFARGLMEQMRDRSKSEKEMDWYLDAEKSFKQALKLEKGNPEYGYYLGSLYAEATQFDQSAVVLRGVLDLGIHAYSDSAMQKWRWTQEIQRAAPGSRIGKRIAIKPQLNRGDLAALLVEELEAPRILKGKIADPGKDGFVSPDKLVLSIDIAPKDMEKHWAKNYAIEINKLGLRGLGLDAQGRFNPDDLVSRAEFALTVETTLMALQNDPKLATRHLDNTQARFKDVHLGVPYYNAACNMVDFGILGAGIDQLFRPGVVYKPKSLEPP
jgi:tetratricopeptide (TPR) repeat protein